MKMKNENEKVATKIYIKSFFTKKNPTHPQFFVVFY